MADRSSVQEIIRASLLLVGAIGQGETPSADEAQDALNRLNDMLDSWSTERANIFTLNRKEFSLGTKQTYTVGPGGDWDMTYAPAKIEECYCQITTTSPTSEIPVRVYNAQEWARITVKGTNSPIPRGIYCDNQWPLANVSVYPLPQGVNRMILYVWQQVNGPYTLSDTLAFPPGYNLAIIFSLADIVAPFYGKSLSEDNQAKAREYKAKIKSKNLPQRYMECDLGTLSPSRVFNWYTGEAR